MRGDMIQIADRQGRLKVPEREVRWLARRLLRRRVVSLAFVEDAEIRRLNRQFLGRDRATDVLAFRLDGGFPVAGGFFGEVVVSAETAAREARRRGIPPREELLRYVTHGILHLLGYDDRLPRQRVRMWNRQERELRRLAAWKTS